jgi:glutamate synthase (ferredoxin)
MVDLEKVVDAAEAAALRRLVESHLERTSSNRARQVLDAWDERLPKFVKVIPRDYKRMLTAIARAEEQGLVGEEAIMVAFEENARDTSRVGGN